MIQIDTANRIILDGKQTGLAVTQNGRGTIVYTPESQISGARYQEHTMPHVRYSLTHDNPALTNVSPPRPGRAQFEADIRALLNL